MRSNLNSSIHMKSELPWPPIDMWIRTIIYYVLIATLIFLLDLGISNLLISVLNKLLNIYAQDAVIYALSGIIGMGLTWIFLRFDDRPLKQIGFFSSNEKIPLFIGGIFITIVALIVSFTIEGMSGIINYSQMIHGLITDPFILVTLALVTLLGIGVGEEIIFRGYIFRVLESNLSIKRAAVLSSIMFGLLHTFLYVTVQQDALNTMIAVGVSAIAFGIMLCYAYVRSGRNLLLPIVIHGTWDFLIFIFNTDFQYDTVSKVLLEISSQIISAILLIIGVWFLTERFPPTNPLPEWKYK